MYSSTSFSLSVRFSPSNSFSRTEGGLSSPPCRTCCRQRSIMPPEIWYLRLAALTDNRPDSTSWTICCLNPVSNFRRCFPIHRLLLAGPSYPLVEPISPTSNSQIFSPVNGAQSKQSLSWEVACDLDFTIAV